jgi:dihydroflavonol-4-reductase
VFLRDPVFAYDRERVVSICEGILARGIDIGWQCESRPEHFDRELLTLMQRAGCNCVKIGLESGAPASLVALGRVRDEGDAQLYLERTTQVALICRSLGLECRVFAMAGLPAEVGEDLAATHRALSGLPRESIIHAKRYVRHPGISLAGAGTEIGHGALQWLRQANTARPPLWRRALRRLARQARREVQGGLVSLSHPHPAAVAPVTQAPVDEVQFDLSEERVFLTGGNGFLGGHVARALAASGAHLVALVRPESALGALADLSCEIVRGDLTDVKSWERELAGCAYFFHTAALYAGSDQIDAMYEVNVAGVSRLLAACADAGVRRVVHTSTVGTVGQGAVTGGFPDETTLFGDWELASHYVRSKRMGEAVAESWNGAGIEVVIVKPTAPIGAGDDRPTATGARLLAALRGDPFSYPAGGINHVPVRDAAMGHLLAARRGVPGRTYILGHRQGNLGVSAFLKLVSDAAGRPLRSEKVSTAASGPASLVANPSRAITELGLPQSDLAGAFCEAVNHFRATGAWRPPSEAVSGRLS